MVNVSKGGTMERWRINLLLVVPVVVFCFSCEEMPTDTGHGNPFDPDNPDVGGDPYELSAEIADGGIRLTWNQIDDPQPEGYNLYRKVDDRTPSLYQELGRVGTYTDREIANGHRYEYFVVARTAAGEADASNIASVALDADPLLIIEGESVTETPTRDVTLTILAFGAEKMILSNESDFAGVQWENYITSKTWQLPIGAGTKNVYMRVVYAEGDTSEVVSDDIEPQLPSSLGLEIVGGDTTTRNTVTLAISADHTDSMRIGNQPDLSDAQWIAFSDTLRDWSLTDGGSGSLLASSNDQDIVLAKPARTGSSMSAINQELPEGSADRRDLRTRDRIVIASPSDDKRSDSHPRRVANETDKPSDKFRAFASDLLERGAEVLDIARGYWTGEETHTPSTESIASVSYTVYARFKNDFDVESDPVSDAVLLTIPGAITINGGDATTQSRDVTLTLNATDAEQMALDTSATALAAGPNWQTYATTVSDFELPTGAGTKTIYVKFRNSDIDSDIYSDDIEPQLVANASIAIISPTDDDTVATNIVDIELAADYADSVMLSNSSDFTGAVWTAMADTVFDWNLAGGGGGSQLASSSGQDIVLAKPSRSGKQGKTNFVRSTEDKSPFKSSRTLNYSRESMSSTQIGGGNPDIAQDLSADKYDIRHDFRTRNKDVIEGPPLLYTSDAVDYTVYARFKNDFEVETSSVSDGVTIEQRPPRPPSNPDPGNGATYVSRTPTLSWTCTDLEGDPLTYDVYFDTNSSPTTQVATGQTDTTYVPGTLNNGVTYYWKVVAHDDHGNSTQGPVWSFATEIAAGTEQVFSLGTSGAIITMVWIPPGPFMMGAQDGEQDAAGIEYPRHEVTISQGFWIGVCEVTQAQWQAVVGPWAFGFDGNPTHPAELVSWDDIHGSFLPVINETETGSPWRLPTEAEWEYACRAGTTTRFYWGDDLSYSEIDGYAWYDGNSSDTTNPVGQKTPNGWGLYDMSGNVWEWCGDWYESYSSGSVTDPTGPSTGSRRVFRGGSWHNDARSCRSAFRSYNYPSLRYHYFGFRLVRYGNVPPLEPSTPSPANAAIDVSLTPTLSWICSDPEGDPLTYDVYFDTSNPPTAQASTGQTDTTFIPGTLNSTTTYYWKVVAHDNHGNSTHGPVWSFITLNQAPNVPSSPSPTDAAIDVSLTPILSWSCSDPESDPLTYDVYFDTSNPPTTQVSTSQTSITYSLGTLNSGTTYYWKVVAHDDHGNSTPGNVWSFTTRDPVEGDEQDFELDNTGVYVTMVWIPAGSFEMGSPDTEQDRGTYEGPVHTVTLTQGFWMGRCEVTQAQWEVVAGTSPFYFDGNPTHPAEQVSWSDIHDDFLPEINATETGDPWRLPTEAEWEYAYRAGTTTRFYWGDDPEYSQVGDYAWYDGNSGGTTHTVGQKTPNGWGLYDMSGNAREWCSDWYGGDYYESSPSTDPTGPSTGSFRIVRGGSWGYVAKLCRSAFRSGDGPTSRYDGIGFRLVRYGNIPPVAPSNPSPNDAATNVSLTPTLSWSCTDPESDPLTYDVYFDTSNPPTTQVSTNQTDTTYSPGTLNSSTTYYWKVVAYDDHGNSTPGSVWSFTTLNQAPSAPTSPSPADAVIDISLTPTLSWSCIDPEDDPLTYDVYFDTSNPPTTQVSTGQTGTTYSPGTLNSSTTYYWKVVAHDDHGNSTPGNVWSFITRDPVEGDEQDFELGNTGVYVTMVWIPSGSYMMGAQDGEQGAEANEYPRHEVTISQGFWMGKYEVIQEQWEAVTGSNPSYFIGINRPVDQISWDEIHNDFLPVINLTETGDP